MGLIHVPRGIRTKRGYAPSDIARSAVESAAPWAWAGMVGMFLPHNRAVRDLWLSSASGTFYSSRPTHNHGALGPHISFDGTNAWDTNNRGVEGSRGRTTVIALRSAVDANKDQSVIAWGGTLGSEAGAAWRINLEGGSIFNRIYEGASEWFVKANDGDWHIIVVSAPDDGTGNDMSLEMDGVSYGGPDSGTTTAINTRSEDGTYTPIRLASGIQSDMHEPVACDIAIAFVTEGQLSLEQRLAVSSDPYAPLRRRPLLVPVSVAANGQVITTGQALDANTAQPIDHSKALAVGQAVETNAAFSVSAASSVAVGQASETNAAQPVTAAKAQTIGQAQEVGTAQAIDHSKAVRTGQAQEASEALPVTAVGVVKAIVGQAAETNTAPSVRAGKTVRVGQSIEVSTAFAANATRSLTVGQALEANAASSLTIRGQATRRVSQVGWNELTTLHPYNEVETLSASRRI